MRRWPRLAQALCNMRGSVRAILQDPPTATLSRIIMLKRCREVIEGDGGPINYLILHSLWCLLKEKHGVTCNKWCINGDMCDSLVIRVEADTNHKSARFLFTPFVIKCMISQKQCHQFIGRHIPLIFCVRKFPIHYRLNDQNWSLLFEIFEKNLGGDLRFWLSVYCTNEERQKIPNSRC